MEERRREGRRLRAKFCLLVFLYLAKQVCGCVFPGVCFAR